MNSGFLPKKPKKGPVELQLTALIDVFSMIVIFLILGGVMGATDIVVPDSMKVPKSKSKEGIESAPGITIEANQVKFSLSPEPIPLQSFASEGGRERLIHDLGEMAGTYLKKQKEAKSPVTAINVIADQNTPYRNLFDVILVFRKLGFTSVLFVATGDSEEKR